MAPFASYGHHYQQQMPPQAPSPHLFTYSGPENSPNTYPLKSSVEYAEGPSVAPLQTSVDYAPKNVAAIQFEVKKQPTTTFQQYYSPGVEYHYSEVVW